MARARLAAQLSAAALLATGLGLASGASATAHKPHRAPAAPASQDVGTDITATISKRPAARPPDPPPSTADSEPLPPPFHLPVASRARMRDCGLKWQTMKMSGKAGDDIWRDFATRCLAAAGGPRETR